MPYIVLGIGLMIFMALVRCLRIVPATHAAYRHIVGALAVLRQAGIPERDKERAIQHAARNLIVAFVDILARSLVAFALPLGIVYGAVAVGLFSNAAATAAAWNPAFLIAATASTVVAWRYVR